MERSWRARSPDESSRTVELKRCRCPRVRTLGGQEVMGRTRMAIRSLLTLVVVIAFVPATASAQAPSVRGTAALVVAEGVVHLDDKSIEPSAVPLELQGDVLVRTAGSRAAIELKRGGWLFLETGSSVRVYANGVSNFNRLGVLSGSAVVVSAT